MMLSNAALTNYRADICLLQELADFSSETASTAGELSDNRLKNRFINILPCMFLLNFSRSSQYSF